MNRLVEGLVIGAGALLLVDAFKTAKAGNALELSPAGVQYHGIGNGNLQLTLVLNATNPTNTPLNIDTIALDIYHSGLKFAEVRADGKTSPMVVPAKVTTTLNLPITVNILSAASAGLQTLLDILQNNAQGEQVQVVGTIGANGYNIAYNENVPLTT